MTTPELDVTFARSLFPALATDWALFDNAGGSVTPLPVIDRVTDYMSRCMVQTGASYPLSLAAARQVSEGHDAAARLLGADPGEVVLGHSTTMDAQVLSHALLPGLGSDAAIIATNADHESNRNPWQRLAERGVEIREWKFHLETGLLRLEDLEPLLDDKVKLVCFTQCSNLFGAIQDVHGITRRVHEAGARVCVDGVAFAPHRRVDVKAWDVDFYLCSLYKIYGPHLGCMYGKREHLLAAQGQGSPTVSEDRIPYKLEPGNPTHELTAAVPGILEYLETLHDHHYPDLPEVEVKLDRAFQLITDHETRLVTPLLSFLDQHPRTTVLGPTSPDPAVRVPTVAFTVEGHKASEIPPMLERSKIAARFGHFYAHAAARDLGLLERDGAVRVSMVHYNTMDEVQRLIDTLDASI